MSQQQLLKTVVTTLESLGIDSMITGSVASSLQGQPRATHDIDLVVALPPEAINSLLRAFTPPEFLLQESVVREAVQNRSMFNLLSLIEGDKVDFWLLTDEPFDASRFGRRKRIALDDYAVNVSSPEDTILAKLRWAKLSGGSEKQFKDALHVFEVQSTAIDHSYLDQWSAILGVDDLWRRLVEEATPV